MAGSRLSNYIREQINAGYDIQAIKRSLLNYGYNPNDVEAAVNSVYNPEVRHVIHFSPGALIAIAAVFVCVIGVGFIVYALLPGGNPSQLLDLNLEPVTTTSSAGSSIVFLTELTNFGSSKRYDVFLKYELFNSGTGEIITAQEETRGIETIGSKQITMNIPPQTAPGNYLLRALATYNEQRAVATLPVVIQEGGPASPPTETPIETPEPIITVDPEPEDEKEPAEELPVEIPTPPLEGDESLTTFETIERVTQIAATNVRDAENLCKELDLQTSRDLCFNKLAEVREDKTYCGSVLDERTKDVCFSNVAKIANSHTICEEISKDSRKDSCYMNFVIDNKDYTVCGKVINQYLKQSCESLKQLSDLNITDVAFYESVLNQSLIEFV